MSDICEVKAISPQRLLGAADISTAGRLTWLSVLLRSSDGSVISGRVLVDVGAVISTTHRISTREEAEAQLELHLGQLTL